MGRGTHCQNCKINDQGHKTRNIKQKVNFNFEGSCYVMQRLFISQPVYGAGDSHGIPVGGKEGSVGRAMVFRHQVVAPVEAWFFNSDCVHYSFMDGRRHLISEKS